MLVRCDISRQQQMTLNRLEERRRRRDYWIITESLSHRRLIGLTCPSLDAHTETLSGTFLLVRSGATAFNCTQSHRFSYRSSCRNWVFLWVIELVALHLPATITDHITLTLIKRGSIDLSQWFDHRILRWSWRRSECSKGNQLISVNIPKIILGEVGMQSW